MGRGGDFLFSTGRECAILLGMKPVSNPWVMIAAAVLGMLSGCGGESVSHNPSKGKTAAVGVSAGGRVPAADPVIAKAGEIRITRRELADLVLEGYGRKVLEEYALLLVTREEAKRRGVATGETVLKEEMDRVLSDMAPGSSRDQQEKLLRFMLQSRGVSRTEFEMLLERQGLLRRMAGGDAEVTEEMLKQEYERLHGRRARVRVLAAESPRKVEEAVRRAKGGADFAQLARELSEDPRTAANDGLLGPFSRQEPEVPLAIREAAFGMTEPGSLSGVISYPDASGMPWWCVIRLEEWAEADGTDPESVRGELVQSARQREIQRRMGAIQNELRARMNLEIYDPILLKEPGR